MSPLSRFTTRLARGCLRAYELALWTLLGGMAAAVALAAGTAQDDPLQCGNIQSSTVVITR